MRVRTTSLTITLSNDTFSVDFGRSEAVTKDTETPELAALRLGKQGLVRAEIAVELGVTLDELQALAAGDEGLARALALADEAALAWWTRLPREAFAAKARFNAAAWSAAVTARFGGPWVGADAARGEAKRPRTAIVLPINGREARWAQQDFGDGDDAAFERSLDEAYERYAAEVDTLLAKRRRSNDD